ncbi:serine/threonine-protein kinase [Nocardia puris]|uniref:non-specific serine/threonine protein kinase n=1 Tax=Nocardia puris TaxID=208602 RepID=A0A366E3C0_9NOCA|nr:serine/threonine-protein kinase [Nocardia puris]
MDGPGWRVGSRFGPYELRALLGKGGMGEVYEAYDTVKDRVVAVKLLSEELAKDPVYQVRFRRESQAAARLAEPHVIPIHDWGVIDGVLFIDMRLVRGLDLRTLLRATGPLDPERAVGLVEQIAAALDAAHAGGLVHRDVKPANILVTDADFAYLVDFGIAHTEGDSAVTQVGMAVGSYIYMAPERFDVGPVTGRADIYSLACVLHECLTGASPFPAASMSVLIKSHLAEPPPRASEQVPGIPPALDDVIARGMAKDPGERFATAMELVRAARAALSGAVRPNPGAGGYARGAHPVPPGAAAGRGGHTTGAQAVPPGTASRSGGHATGAHPIPPGAAARSGGHATAARAVPPSAGSHPTGHTTGAQPLAPGAAVRPPVVPGQTTGAQPDPAVSAPTFVVRVPARFADPDGTGANPVVPPESTGEMSIPAVIRPSDPTAVHPTEIEFTPLPTQEQPAVTPPPPSATGPIPQVRPFPDAHLYPEEQRYADPAEPYEAPETRVYPSVAQPAPETRAYGAAEGYGNPDAGYGAPDSGYGSPEGAYGAAQGTYANPDAAYASSEGASGNQGAFGAPDSGYGGPGVDPDGQLAPETRRYPEPPFPPPAQPRHTAEPAPRPTYPDYGAPAQAYSAVNYDDSPQGGYDSPRGYGAPGGYDGPGGGDAQGGYGAAGGYGAQGGYDQQSGYDQHGYDQQSGYDPQSGYGAPDPNRRGYDHDRSDERRSVVMPVLVSLLAIVAIAVVGVVGWQVLRGGGDEPAAVGTTAAPRTTPPAAGPATSDAPTTAPTTTSATPVRLPAGATACGADSAPAGQFSRAAIGNSVTSCPFAEEVRRAYAASESATVVATSPVTGRTYTMTCTPQGQLVACSGGENALVYVY